MLSPRLFKLAVSGIGLVVALAGCSSGTPSSQSGNGGSSSDTGGSGSGGMSNGGAMGAGGMSNGGATGAGGMSSGGATGSGGMSSGGATGSGAGGMSGSGSMAMGSGGMSSGGAAGSGAGGEMGSGGAAGGHGGSAGTMNGAGGHSGGGGSTGSAMGGAGGSGSGSFTLTSPDLMEGAHFDAKFTCAASNGTFGSGVNPELDWSGAPDGTLSFAITFIDTTLGDTNPMGQHWAIWNIPATVMKFPQATATLTGDLATAKQSGKFLTPCAQSLTNNMDDQYEFTVYALSTATLDITGTTVANALTALKAASPLGKATLHGHAGLKGM